MKTFTFFCVFLPCVMASFVCRDYSTFIQASQEHQFYCMVIKLPCEFVFDMKKECDVNWSYFDDDHCPFYYKCPEVPRSTEKPEYDFYFEEEEIKDYDFIDIEEDQSAIATTPTPEEETTTEQELEAEPTLTTTPTPEQETLTQLINELEAELENAEPTLTTTPTPQEETTTETAVQDTSVYEPEEETTPKGLRFDLRSFGVKVENTMFCPDGKRFCKIVAQPLVGKCLLCMDPCDGCQTRVIVQDAECPEWECFPLKEDHTADWVLGVSAGVIFLGGITFYYFFDHIKRWFVHNVYERIPGIDLPPDTAYEARAENGIGPPTAPAAEVLLDDLNEGNQPIITNNRLRREVRRFSRRLTNCCSAESTGLENENFVNNV